jgi:hypothetical protein
MNANARKTAAPVRAIAPTTAPVIATAFTTVVLVALSERAAGIPAPIIRGAACGVELLIAEPINQISVFTVKASDYFAYSMSTFFSRTRYFFKGPHLPRVAERKNHLPYEGEPI